MIKINLLPKEIEKKAAARMRGILIGGVIVLVAAVFVGAYFMRITTLASLKNKVEKAEEELKKLTPVVNRVNEIQNKKAALDTKIGVIKNLMKSRLLYPVFMEKFASMLPPKIWITNLNTQTGENTLTVSLNVMSRDNYGVADFINTLESSEEFTNVGFSGLSTTVFEGAEVRSFNISFTYAPSES